MNWSIAAVGNVCRRHVVKIWRKAFGRKAKLTPQARRLMGCQARTRRYCARQLWDILAPHMSARRIKQVLQDAAHFEFKPRETAPNFTPLHLA